jgi:hypothetical protein
MKPLEIALREIVNDIVKTCKEMNRKIDYPEWVPVGYRVSIDESISSIKKFYPNFLCMRITAFTFIKNLNQIFLLPNWD